MGWFFENSMVKKLWRYYGKSIIAYRELQKTLRRKNSII